MKNKNFCLVQEMKFSNKSLNCGYNNNACCRSPNVIYVSEHQERKKLDSIEQVSFTTNV